MIPVSTKDSAVGYQPVCRDCKWVRRHSLSKDWRCGHPINTTTDLVSGDPMYKRCSVARRQADCGPKGKLFAPGSSFDFRLRNE